VVCITLDEKHYVFKIPFLNPELRMCWMCSWKHCLGSRFKHGRCSLWVSGSTKAVL